MISLRSSHPDRAFMALVWETLVSPGNAPPCNLSKSAPAERTRSRCVFGLHPESVGGQLVVPSRAPGHRFRRLGSAGISAVGAGALVQALRQARLSRAGQS